MGTTLGDKVGRRETDIERGVQVEVDGDTKMGPREERENESLCMGVFGVCMQAGGSPLLSLDT